VTDLDKYGPWAVIAGGSEGVGAEFARQLAQDGFGLVLIARKPGPLEQTAQTCREFGVPVRTLSVDLLEPDAVQRITDVTRDIEVGLFIYNAGASTCNAPFLDAPVEEFQKVVDLNVTRMLPLVQHYARPMAERGRGGILLVGSLAGYMGSWGHGTYGGAKAFSRVFAEGLWLELRDRGVDVLELVLGVTRTPAMERAGLNFDVPGLKVGDPAEVAAEGLAHLADGPVYVADGNAPLAAANSAPDRAAVVLGAHEQIRALAGRRG